jgi:hypothetical protein
MPHSGRAHADPVMRKGRRGRPWRRAREIMFATQGDVCWRCGHPGSTDAGHRVALTVGGDPLDPRNLSPEHGYMPCPTCGKRCNQEAGNGTQQGRRRGGTSHMRTRGSEQW